MGNYHTISEELSWNKLLLNCSDDNCSVYLRDEDNFIFGFGSVAELILSSDAKLDELNAFIEQHSGQYIFGYLGYDLKNQIETKLSSKNTDLQEFAESYFYIPEHIILSIAGEIIYNGPWDQKQVEEYLEQQTEKTPPGKQGIELALDLSYQQYISSVKTIKDRIQRGDIYEVNYCLAYKAETSHFEGRSTFIKLAEKAEAPFSSYTTIPNGEIICASPERFFKKVGRTLTSQPIKGTARRDRSKDKDDQIKAGLKEDPKERSENIMIVDLVRNDLSKVATKNSVEVTELCEIYSFKTVHQLVSTVQCKAKEKTHLGDVIKALFPMGSMTGAPKISAMKIIEEMEDFKRGVYSGAIGIVHPNGNADFNVVIRSILYNKKRGRVIAPVGGAITIKSDPHKEFEECQTKLKAIKEAVC